MPKRPKTIEAENTELKQMLAKQMMDVATTKTVSGRWRTAFQIAKVSAKLTRCSIRSKPPRAKPPDDS